MLRYLNFHGLLCVFICRYDRGCSLQLDEVYKRRTDAFFSQSKLSKQSLSKQIPKEQAHIIAQELSSKDRELARIVEEKSAQLEPNPLKNLSQRDLAIKIYRETLYEVFAKVLKSHGITDEDRIQTLLNDLQESRSKALY